MIVVASRFPLTRLPRVLEASARVNPQGEKALIVILSYENLDFKVRVIPTRYGFHKHAFNSSF